MSDIKLPELHNGMTGEQQLQNLREWRSSIGSWLVIILSACPGLFNAWISYRNGDRMVKVDDTLVKADTDRVRIEEKIDEQKKETKVAVAKAETAVENAVTAAQEVKIAAAETKTVIMELKEKVEPKPIPPE